MTVTGPDIVPDAQRDAVDAHHAVSLTYEPALDGLRALAVGGVLLFHGEFSWAEGGYLGVSTFFTLSGFLITSLLLGEHRRSGTVSLRGFWTRRVRRLMPASLVALLFACAFGALAADPAQLASLRGDVLAALAYVANWRFLVDGQSYAELFSGPSPVLQFWSLAIEEQFYLLYPLVFVAVVRSVRRSDDPRRRLTAVLVVLAVASVALSASGALSDDAVYLSTPTRAAELLVGCLLGVALSHPAAKERLSGGATARSAGIIGGAALLTIVTMWATVGQDSAWLYHGGFAAYALLSAAVIVACIAPTALRTGLSWEPLRRLGLISYGVYLYHWPVFLWIDARTDLDGVDRFVLGATAAVVLAAISVRAIENPVRRHGRLASVPAARLAPFGVAAVVVTAVLVTLDPPRPLVDEAAAQDSLDAAIAANTGSGPADGPVGPGASPVPRVGMYGDSTATVLSVGFFTWVAETPGIDGGPGFTGLGCPIGRGGELRAGVSEGPLEEWCSWSGYWIPEIRDDDQDVAVVLAGPWDTADRKLPGSDEWQHIGQPAYDEWLLGELVAFTDAAAAEGAEVIWLTSPPVVEGRGDRSRNDDTADPARMARWNELLGEVVAARPGDAHLIDLAGWLERSGRDAEMRPDGIHLTDEASYAVTAELLGPAVLDIWAEEQPAAG